MVNGLRRGSKVLFALRRRQQEVWPWMVLADGDVQLYTGESMERIKGDRIMKGIRFN